MSAKVATTVVAASLAGISSVLGNLLLILACLNKVSGKVNVFLINLCVTDILLTGKFRPLNLYYLIILQFILSIFQHILQFIVSISQCILQFILSIFQHLLQFIVSIFQHTL